jgi:hypothetical protein
VGLTVCFVTAVASSAGTTTSPCGDPSWEVVEDQQLNGGEGYPAITSLAQCLAECIAKAECVAVNIDTTTNRQAYCWLINDATYLASPSSKTGIDNWVLLDRCPGCTPDFSVLENTAGSGATQRADIATEDECLTYCNSDINCVGADIDLRTGNTLCWLFYSQEDLTNTRVDNGIKHYTLQQRCTCKSPAVVCLSFNAHGRLQLLHLQPSQLLGAAQQLVRPSKRSTAFEI